MAGFADCCEREAAWLATSGDGLPALLAADGGKWDVVQAHWPGARLAANQHGIYVTPGRYVDQLPSASRVRPQYVFRVKVTWPVLLAAAQIAEGEQAAFYAAIADLVARVRGPFGDKTHGGRFLSVGAVPERAAWPAVVPEDPAKTLPARHLAAAVTYMADDLETDA